MKVGRLVLQKATACRSRSKRGVKRDNSISLAVLKDVERESLFESKGWGSTGEYSTATGLWCEESPGAELGPDYSELGADGIDAAPPLVEKQLRSLQRQLEEYQQESQRQLEEYQQQSQQQLEESQRQLVESQLQQVESQRQLEECQQQLVQYQELVRKLAGGSFQTSSG